VLLRVAFVTLLERKILGYIQLRKGPNKVGFIGIFQPFADAVKLFSKENNFLIFYNKLIYYISPIISLILILCFWLVFPWNSSRILIYDFIYILVISSIRVYVILGGGWASNSKYSLLGAYRGVAQTISYEVRFSFILLRVLILRGRFNLTLLIDFQWNTWNFFGLWNLFILWLVTILAETNRAPFDFAEGESELVSGFNVEYGGGGFAILFIAEYGNIIFICLITVVIFFGSLGVLRLNLGLFIFFFLWVRGTFVRFRYDFLIILAWKIILPYRIMLLIIIINLVIIIFI